ncbi:accessory Sec system protein Asp2 [Pediococcus acidilactici]|uniref:accessory Sec system protein Asp2 n=1 Tax=Pediococcus acidilactici TaxID=1254 RepID=UPI00132FC033|nr:accessory Sec system protein Asp2 [Pediococcus acidilactici]KAF0498728.1 accessory Sec system protein Asp2 [Pediococcus acidilactici]MBM6585711.1 accessory Sec system protein Asp2 [Pediococcus acidilactici]MCF4060980.1 accessory Sec system protein Asp2 [Pediococcus acidilactici]NRD13841.1 accessory Sec system protein Asp2 [Pediococcus acidilactici]
MSKMKIIHLGPKIEGLAELIENDFEIFDVPLEVVNQPIGKEKKKLLIKGELNLAFRHDMFLITQPEYLAAEQSSLLKELPANNILIDDRLELSKEATQALHLKNAQFISIPNAENLAKQFKEVFYNDQLGFKYTFDNIQFDSLFKGTVKQLGHNYLRIIDNDIEEYQRVANWDGPIGVGGNTLWEIHTEFKRNNPTTNVRLRVSLISPADAQIYYSKEVDNDQLKNDIPLEVNDDGAFILVELLVKGKDVDLTMGAITLNEGRDGRGTLLIGEDMEIDDEAMGEPLYHYFDPGDFKPPLMVYFSGFRFNPGVEGMYMMRSLKGPSLLIEDFRILGGAFYVGGKKLESQIINLIQSTLKKLGFKPNELILSGLSMGTFASLYYSSFLNPDWVIVGKPLTSLGEIAANERINRPGGFPTSLDVVLRLTGGIADENIKQADDIFWNSFTKHDHSKTNFVIVYMKDDDYDGEAFEKLDRFLRKHSPTSRIIHKGFTGRHNDQTGALGAWFKNQYQNILTTNYGRDFSPQEDDEDDE